MARNRKYETAAARLRPALKALLLCGFCVLSGVGYVWYKDQINILGRQLKERENRLTELQRQNKVKRDQLAALCSPPALDARVRELNLNLAPPALAQVIRLVETPIQTASTAVEQSPRTLRQAHAEPLERDN